MKNKIFSYLLLLLPLLSFSQTYITNVTVVDVKNKKLVPAQTVTFSNNKITQVQSFKKAKVPQNATVIDGSNQYLMPGMTDGHVHFFQSGGLYARPDAIDLRKQTPYETEIAWVHKNMEDFLRRYTKSGITTVVDVGATPNFLKKRKDFANKDFAPKIYMTGPLLTSWEPDVYQGLKENEPFNLVTTPEQGRAMVQQQLPLQPDFIKIWYITDPEKLEESARKFLPVAKAIIDEAHKNKLKVAVHATELLTAQLAVESGCDYLVHGIEDKIITADFVKLLKDKKTVLCPTLIVADGYNTTFAQNITPDTYELDNANAQQIGSLFDLKHLQDTTYSSRLKSYMRSKTMVASERKTDSIRKVNLKKLSDAGVTIVVGTDAGNIGTQHAASYIRELKAMLQSGMSNWQVLQAASINSAELFDPADGSIDVGKNANLVLLSANPLENLDNLTKINLIINKGNILQPEKIIAPTPFSLAQQQLNGYNARNIEAFLAPYADDVELYNFPDKLMGKGKEAMRKTYKQMFDALPDLHCEVKERIVQGNTVIDHERVRIRKNEFTEVIAIYKIENGKIKKVYFIQ